MKSAPLALTAALLLALPGTARAATEIRFWHSMSGALGDHVAELAGRFNASQKEYLVAPLFKSGFDESIAAALGAARSVNAPHLIQADDSATEAIMATNKAIRPLHQLMDQARERFDARAFLPAVAGPFVDRRGRLVALPFSTSTATFYYNKDVFRKAGLDPEKAPGTWREVQQAALRIQASAAAPCGYTTGWQSWVQLENLSAWHNQPVATRSNGFEGAGANFNFNGELLMRHVSLLSSWAKSGLFTYAGRGDEGDRKFAGGECAMLTSSSGAYTGFAETANLSFGVGPLPYYDEFPGAPYNTTVRGTALWVIAGKKPAEYRGVAKFIRFLSSADVQADWHMRTRFLPVSLAGYELARTQGHYERSPGRDTAIRQMSRRTEIHTRGLRLRNFAQVRAVIDEELEAVWSQMKTPKEALDAAVERGNELLRGFERTRMR